MNKINFYSVIIGTELLNGRRKDAHFSFLNQQLLERGWEHKASFVIEDDPELMLNIFNLIFFIFPRPFLDFYFLLTKIETKSFSFYFTNTNIHFI